MTDPRRIAVALAASVALVATFGSASATAPTSGRPVSGERAEPLAVTGFALASMRSRVVHRNAEALTTVTVAGIGITVDGARVARPTADMRRLSDAAHADGLRSELLVSNYNDRLGDFDPVALHRLLSSTDHIDAIAATVAGHVADDGWDGVNVDLERVRTTDAAGLVAFVAALQAALPAEQTVSIDISASTSVRGFRDRGYDLAALAEVADVIAIMAYDQHGPTWSGPGPIGALGWQRDTLDAVLTQVPAALIDLGVAGYGYSWPTHGTGRSLTVEGARNQAAHAGVEPVWHAQAGEWSARLPGGTVLWWSDARSLRQRVALAHEYGVHGLALWRLDSADPL